MLFLPHHSLACPLYNRCNYHVFSKFQYAFHLALKDVTHTAINLSNLGALLFRVYFTDP